MEGHEGFHHTKLALSYPRNGRQEYLRGVGGALYCTLMASLRDLRRQQTVLPTPPLGRSMIRRL